MNTITRLCCALAALLVCVTIFSNRPAHAQGTWSTITSMSTLRQIPMGGAIGSKFYMVGGYNGSTYVNTGEVYDPSTNAWTAIAPMPSTRGGAAEAVLNGKLYITGGYAFPQPTHLGYQTTTIVYDPTTNTWTTLAPLPINRSNAPSVAVNGKLYVLCGDNSGAFSNRVDIYDPTTNAWTTGAAAPIHDYAAAAVLNGKIYVVGGYNGSVTTNAVDIYDPVANTWSTGTPMNNPREALEVQAVGGKLYAVGGRNNSGYLNTGEYYNPATNTWTALPTMSVNHSFYASGVIGNKLYVAGGYSGTANIATAEVLTTVPSSGDLLISEFRLYGATGSTDEYVELYNNTDGPITVRTTDGSSGFSVATALNQATSTTLFVIPNNTVIPARGHYLGVNSAGYSLGAYATGNATYTSDTFPNVGIALFTTSNTANFSTATRLDAVGSTLETNALYKEGAGYAPLTFITNRQHAFLRDLSSGKPRDTQDNASDFVYVNTDGANDGVGARLGAPGPENLSSPINRSSSFATLMLDSTQPSTATPNRDRDFTSDPATNASQGTMTIRRRFVNQTGASITKLRFRIIVITGSPAPDALTADLRPRTSSNSTVNNVNDAATCSPAAAPCSVNVSGTVLESPSAANNGGINSSLLLSSVTTAPQEPEEFVPLDGRLPPTGADAQIDPTPGGEGEGEGGTINLSTPLANNASINVQFVFGVQQPGRYRFYINIEALP